MQRHRSLTPIFTGSCQEKCDVQGAEARGAEAKGAEAKGAEARGKG